MKPTRILSDPKKVPREESGGYCLLFETDAGEMSSIQIMESTKMPPGVFWYRGKTEGWTTPDFFRPFKVRKKKMPDEIRKSKMLGDYKKPPPCFVREQAQEEEGQKDMMKRIAGIDQQYLAALRNASLSERSRVW